MGIEELGHFVSTVGIPAGSELLTWAPRRCLLRLVFLAVVQGVARLVEGSGGFDERKIGRYLQPL